jgi:hypothetical protein
MGVDSIVWIAFGLDVVFFDVCLRPRHITGVWRSILPM